MTEIQEEKQTEVEREPDCEEIDNDEGQPSKKRAKTCWSERNIYCLLTACRQHSVGRSGRTAPKWGEVAESFFKLTGIRHDAVVCKTKWQNIKKEYSAWSDEQSRTGSERKEYPFADIMWDILKNAPDVKPKVLGTQGGRCEPGTSRNVESGKYICNKNTNFV